MSQPAAQDAIAALERLYAKKVITLEEGQAAARLLTGDPAYAFPPPAAPPEPPAAEAAPPSSSNGDGSSSG